MPASVASFISSHHTQHQVYASTLAVCILAGALQAAALPLKFKLELHNPHHMCRVGEDRRWSIAGGVKHAYHDTGLCVKPFKCSKQAHRENAGGRDAYTTCRLHLRRNVHAAVPRTVRVTVNA